jgi:hypothetical protein
MAVRGTTVARHNKLVIIRDPGESQGEKINCAWYDCENLGYMNHRTVINEGKPGFPPQYKNYVFCSENCKYYFDRSHIPGEYGRLPNGIRSRWM